MRDELPHSLAVVIDEVNPREDRDDLIDVHALLYVERDSQKGIVIGKGGARLRKSAPRRAGRSRSCWAPRSTSTFASRSLRTGRATPNSSDVSGSDAEALTSEESGALNPSSRTTAPVRWRPAGA